MKTTLKRSCNVTNNSSGKTRSENLSCSALVVITYLLYSPRKNGRDVVLMIPAAPCIHSQLTCSAARSLSGPVVPVTCQLRGNPNAKDGSCTGYISVSSPCVWGAPGLLFTEKNILYSWNATSFFLSFPLSALSSQFKVTFISS